MAPFPGTQTEEGGKGPQMTTETAAAERGPRLPDGSTPGALTYLSWLFQEQGERFPTAVYESVWASLVGGRGGELSPALARETLRWSSAGRGTFGESWPEAWMLFCKHLPAGAAPSWRWKGLQAVKERGELDYLMRELCARPGIGGEAFYGPDYDSEDYDSPPFYEGKLPYPPRRVTITTCACADCNSPATTSDFMDPRSEEGGPHFEDFGLEERQAFLRLVPPETLHWSRDAWEHEAAFDAEVVKDYGGRKDWPGWPASLYRRRALLLEAAAEVLGAAAPPGARASAQDEPRPPASG